jgi:hypothetical protein
MELRSTVGLWVTVRRDGLNVSCPYRAPDKSRSLATLGMTSKLGTTSKLGMTSKKEEEG